MVTRSSRHQNNFFQLVLTGGKPASSNSFSTSGLSNFPPPSPLISPFRAKKHTNFLESDKIPTAHVDHIVNKNIFAFHCHHSACRLYKFILKIHEGSPRTISPKHSVPRLLSYKTQKVRKTSSGLQQKPQQL